MIVKAEVTAHFGRKPKGNPRFVVTNLKRELHMKVDKKSDWNAS